MVGEYSRALVLWAAAIGLVPCASAQAAAPMKTDDAGTVAARAVEIELGGDIVDLGRAGVEPGVAAHFGVSDALAAGIGIAPGTLGGGFTPEVSLDLKLRLLDAAGNRPSLALRLDYGLPASDSSTRVGVTAIATRPIAGHALHLNVGAWSTIGGEASERLISAALGFEASASESLTGLGELVVDLEPGGDTTVSATAGLSLPIGDLGLGIAAGPTRSGRGPVRWGLRLVLTGLIAAS